MSQANSPANYDLVIIGAGAAGLTAANAAATLGVRVALVEGQRIGGECTWTGCIPSKTLLAIAQLAHDARQAGSQGINIGGVDINFAQVMTHVRNTMEQIAADESVEILQACGIDVYEMFAEFVDAHTLALADGTSLRSKRFLICTGANPKIPPGFAHVSYLTNESLFDLTALPAHLMIVGGGPVGVEMAQAFRRLGSTVTLISSTPQLLPRDDVEAANLIADVLCDEGVDLRLGVTATHAEQQQAMIEIYLDDGTSIEGDAVLLAVGKQPNFARLNLKAAGVQVQAGNLVLDDRLRTSQPHILAAGDVTGGPQFTHYAGWQAFQAVRNALLPLSSRGVRQHVPWSTFTDPEVAQAGLTEAQARRDYGDTAQVTRLPMSRADRAMTEGKPAGFMKLIHLPNGRLLGTTIVGVNAAEMINDWVKVLEKRGRVWDAASAMRVYPSFGTANVILATEQIRRQVATGWLGRVMHGLVRLNERL